MARARLIKPGFFSNAALSEIPPYGRLLFVGMWGIADREGRMKDEPRWIKGAVFPYENPPVVKLLEMLATSGFIQRYEADGQKYIQIVNFLKHQNPHKNEVDSVIPAPETDALERAAPSNGASASSNGGSARAGTGTVNNSGSNSGDGDSELAPSADGSRPPRSGSGRADDWDFTLHLYRQNIEPRSKPLDDIARRKLRGYYDRLSHEWLFAAINQAATAQDPGFGYVDRILADCERTNSPPSSLRKAGRLAAAR